MPTYQYRCRACANELEAFQKFTDDPLTTCPQCSGPLRKLFSPVGIVFKGSGFYATDSRKAGGASSAAKSEPAKAAPAAKTEASATSESTSPTAKSQDSTAA